MKKSQLRQIIREVIRETGMSKGAKAADTNQSDAEYIKQQQRKLKGVDELKKSTYKAVGNARRAQADYYETQAAIHNDKADRARDMQFGQTKLRNTAPVKKTKKEAWDAKTQTDKAKRDADAKNKDRQTKGWEMDRQKKMENALHALNDKIQPAINKNKCVNKDVPEKEFLAKTGLTLSQLASYRHIYERAFPRSSDGMDFDLISYDPRNRTVYVKDPMDV